MNSNIFKEKKKEILNLFKQKKFIDVIKKGKNLYKKVPNDPQLLYLLGLVNINIQNFLEAEKYFEKLISIKQNSEIYYIFGNIQKKLKKYKNAIIFFENAIKLNPNFSEAYNNLGNTKKIIHKRDEAILDYEKAISLKEDNIEALFNLSTILKENNKYQELIPIYKKILRLDKNNIKTIYNLGSTYLFLGKFFQGRDCFEKAISINKLHIPSLRNYISITKIDNKNKIFKILESINTNELDNENKILTFNALSKGYFDQNNIEIGFQYLNKSNNLKKKISKFSIAQEEKLFKNIKFIFEQSNSINIKYDNQVINKPIFILGMPRSGTSLLEQILSTHSKIHGSGELNFLPDIIEKFGLNFQKNVKLNLKEIRNYYLEKISKISNSPYIIDKLPINFKWIGFIIKSIPEAKIIHVQRNPMAVCWSNYKTHFIDSGMDFNLSQEDVAKYYAMYLDLMSFWRLKFKDKFLNLNYENFVSDYELGTKKILNYLDLEWEDKIRSYEKTNRPVTTASYQQVRERIKKNTSNEWKKYQSYLVIMQETLKKLNIDINN